MPERPPFGEIRLSAVESSVIAMKVAMDRLVATVAGIGVPVGRVTVATTAGLVAPAVRAIRIREEDDDAAR